jgi:hypothetical protein
MCQAQTPSTATERDVMWGTMNAHADCMTNRIPWLLAALLSTPALPCSFAPDDLTTSGLITSGELDVPTQVHVAFSPTGVWDTAQIDLADSADDAEPVAVVNIQGEQGLVGLVTLAPRQRYRLTATGIAEPIIFSTGVGEDTIAPAAPQVELELFNEPPTFQPVIDSCGGGPFWPGSTYIEVSLTVDPDVVGVIARDPSSGAALTFGRRSLTFFESDDVDSPVEIVVVDRAGNESEPVLVELDFGEPGGCSQAGPGAVGWLSAAWLVAVFSWRRRAGRDAQTGRSSEATPQDG